MGKLCKKQSAGGLYYYRTEEDCIHTMTLTGIDAINNTTVEISFSQNISSVDELIHPVADAPLFAPGWIDLQVNGFAGCDYNSPAASHEAIARSIRAQRRRDISP